MLTFFRRIRKELLDMGAARKYLLYAVGEITLVVIGILIALQINNWNTSRHLKQQEKSLLFEIKRNIETNIIETNQDISSIDDQIVSIDIFITHLNGDLPFHDSLSSHHYSIFSGRYFNGVTSGYEVLKNQPEITLNDDLRFALTTYFEEALYDVEHFMKRLIEFNDKYMSDYRLIYRRRDGFTSEVSDVMRKDDLFRATLDLLKDNRTSRTRRLRIFQEQSEEVLRKLQSYIEDEFGNQ